MGAIPHQSQAQQARGLFAPPGFQATDQGGGGGDSPKPKPFESAKEIMKIIEKTKYKDPSRPGLSDAPAVERALSKDDKDEWIAVFSPKGHIRSFRKGRGRRGVIKANPAYWGLMEDAVVIHNHPTGSLEPSDTDLDLVRKHGASKLIIVAPGKDGHKRRELTKEEAMRIFMERH